MLRTLTPSQAARRNKHPVKSFSPYQARLAQIKRDQGDRLLQKFQLHCEAGLILNSAALLRSPQDSLH